MKKATATKHYGWRGKILQVNLNSKTIQEEDLSAELMTGYIGGAGINARLLYDRLRINPHVDALAPDNPLIFGFGPAVGTVFPCATRFTVTAKSPLTGLFGDSNAGGFFGVQAKKAGYDHIVITGASETPVALLITPGNPVQLIDADDLWGLDTYETDALIARKFGACESARIGPAGEHLVRYANIFSGRRRVSASGRAGMGCVMGSKKLKAIIVRGTGTVPVADKKQLDELVSRYRAIWGNGPGTAANAEYGTLMLIAQIGAEAGIKNDQGKISDEQLERYDLEEFLTNYKRGKTACYRCPVGCSQTWGINQGPFRGEHGDKIEK